MQTQIRRRRMTLESGLDKAGAQEAVDTYMSSLGDLTVNSKPHINSLTMLAEDYLNYAEAIVNAVDDHLKKVASNVKLPILYLIDSIIKNVRREYITLFSRTIVQSFSTVFHQVDEKTRQQMYKLRQTWNDIFSQENLYTLDVQVNALDPKWPITAAPTVPHKIHVNPRFFTPAPAVAPVKAIVAKPAEPVVSQAPAPAPAPAPASERELTEAELLREQLLQKKKGLLLLQQRRVDLELSEMKAKLDKKQQAVSKMNKVEGVSPVNCEIVPAVPTTTIVADKVNVVKEAVQVMKEVSKKSKSEVERIDFPVKLSAIKQEVKQEIIQDTPQKVVTTVAGSTRIAPVSSGLVNLVTSQRSLRDPRLAKPASDVGQQAAPSSSDSDKLRVKGRDPRMNIKTEKRSRSQDKEVKRSSSRSAEKESKHSRSPDKDLSKSSRHRSRESSSDRTSRHSSRREQKEKRTSDRKSGRKSEERTSPRSRKSSTRSPSKGSSKRERRIEHRSERSSRPPHRVVSDCADSQDSDGGADSDVKEKDRERGTSAPPPPVISFAKSPPKGRNYVRRNIRQESPEVPTTASDVDLRVGGLPEQHSRLSAPADRPLSATMPTIPSGVTEQILPTLASQDVDLRCLPSSPGKKRRSVEPEDEPPTKKNKAARMELLFGNQDVDLRQLDSSSVAVANGATHDAPAPSPPPPPVISGSESQAQHNDFGWSKFKQTMSPSPTIERSPAFPKSSRHDRLGHTFESRDRRRNEDIDMRLSVNGFSSNKSENLRAILARADEQLKNGTISREDFEKVQQQVFQMNEAEKVREAQRNEFTRRDAWERRPHRERDYRHGMGSPNEQFGDIDERYPKPIKKPLLPLPSVPPIQGQGQGHLLPTPHIRQRMPGPMGPGPGMGPGPRLRPQRPLLRTPGPYRGPRMSHNNTPVADPILLERIAQDPMRTITIDGFGREIRFYGNDAVAILSDGDDPHEITFDPGEAKVIIDETVVVQCAFGEPDKEVCFGGQTHRVRLGAPTREIYIDDEGFECQFNGLPIEVHLRSGETYLVQLQTDAPPKVHIGRQRKDLVAGRVFMVIDAKQFVPVFLDAKPQRFDIDGVPHILRFVDALKTVLINNHRFPVEFGGGAVPIPVNNTTHYIRLTKLPQGVIPGEVNIVSMAGIRGKAPAPVLPAPAPAPAPAPIAAVASPEQDHDPVMPVSIRGARGTGRLIKNVKPKLYRDKDSTERDAVLQAHEDRQMPRELFNAIQPGLPSLLGLLPSAIQPNYSPETPLVDSKPTGLAAVTSAETAPSVSSSAPAATNVVPELSMDDLLHRLVATGLMSSLSTLTDSKKKDKEEVEVKKKVHQVNFKESQSLKIKQPGIVDLLYSGIQCSSCGTRFPPEQTVKYSQHLDWHFRQNRRDRDSARKPQSRKWYYDVTDWIQFEEIEDVEEKGQNWFDTQQSETMRAEEPEPEESHSIPASEVTEGTVCGLCHDRFEQFFNEESEDWHLKDCMKVDEAVYHPLCYKDYRVSLDSNEGLGLSEEETVKVEAGAVGENGEEMGTEIIVKEEPKDDIDSEMKEAVEAEQSSLKEEPHIPDLTPEEQQQTKMEVSEEGEAHVKEENTDEPMDTGESTSGSNAENPLKMDAATAEEEEGSVDAEAAAEAVADVVAAAVAAVEDAEAEENSKGSDELVLQTPLADTTHTSVACSIDGNVELMQAPSTLPSAPTKIKINISKPIVSRRPTDPPEEGETEPDKTTESENVDEMASSSESNPPREALIVLKPKLIGRKLTDIPPVAKGEEVSGLCSIM